MTKRSTSLIALFAITAAACTNNAASNSGDAPYRVGSLTFAGQSNGTVTTGRPNGFFFSSISATLPTSRNPSDSCQVAPFDTTTFVQSGNVNAGTPITATVKGGANSAMSYDPALQLYPLGPAISYAAGDTVTFSVPGNGTSFPAAIAPVRTAEPFTISSVGTLGSSPLPLHITWSGSGDSTSAMLFSVRYAAAPAVGGINESIICNGKDDGSFDIPAAYLTRLQNSTGPRRELVMTRYRTAYKTLDDRTVVVSVATFVQNATITKAAPSASIASARTFDR
jgi:hypothetical protein